MIFLVSVIQEKILCLVDGSRLDKYAEVLICRFVYRILPRIYIHSTQRGLHGAIVTVNLQGNMF